MVVKSQRRNLKEFAKKYGISVLREDRSFKSINELSIDVYEYEVVNQRKIEKPYYPFLKIKK